MVRHFGGRRHCVAAAIIALSGLATAAPVAPQTLARSGEVSASLRSTSLSFSKPIDLRAQRNFADLAAAAPVLARTSDVELALHMPFHPGVRSAIGLPRALSLAHANDREILIQRGTGDGQARVIYRSDFDNPLNGQMRDEWSYGGVRETPEGRRFLGTIGNGSTTLTISPAPARGAYVLQFDVLAVGPWMGNSRADQHGAPEVFGVRVVDGPTLVETNFATVDGTRQAYPDSIGLGGFEPGTQSIERFRTGDGSEATVYRMAFRFNRTASVEGSSSEDVRIEFYSRGLPEGQGAPAWGLSNVVLALVPDSGAGGGGGTLLTRRQESTWGQPREIAMAGSNFGLMPPGPTRAESDASDPSKDASKQKDKDQNKPPAEVPTPGGLMLLGVWGMASLRRSRRGCAA